MDKLSNYELFLKKLNQLGIDTAKLAEEYGEKLADASFSINSENGLAYDGSLIEVILYKLTPYAIRLNELFPEAIRADKASLIKVCLLHQIAKAVRLVTNDNEWEIKNRGLLYKYVQGQPSIRTGLHSLVIANNCGITFTPEEAEANLYLTLVNRTHKLPDNWENRIELLETENYFGEPIRVERASDESYQALRAALLEEGVNIELESCYR